MLIVRSVLAEVLRNLVAGLVATTGMAFFLLSIRFLEQSPGVGLGFLVEIFPLFFPLALQFTVPLAVLAGTVMTFSRMAADGEITALAASGVPLRTVASPVLALAAVVALLAFLLTDVASPYAAARLRAAQRDLPNQLRTAFRSGLCDLDLGNGRISFESFGGRDFVDVCVEWRTGEDIELWRAERGSIAVTPDDRVVIALKSVQRVLPWQRQATEVFPAAREVVVERPLGDLMLGSGRKPRTSMTASELAYVGARGGDGANSAREELARRSALAGSAFFYALVGIPLGVFAARGGRIGAFLFAIAPVLAVYLPLVVAMSGLARTGRLSAFPALWAGNALLLVAGVALHRRLARR
jgi:lipopolysaccharide export LptBFGC system permease protein LptF